VTFHPWTQPFRLRPFGKLRVLSGVEGLKVSSLSRDEPGHADLNALQTESHLHGGEIKSIDPNDFLPRGIAA
jgi:hypothetical protein